MANSDQKMIYRFHKPGFVKYQSTRFKDPKKRPAILVHRTFPTDSDVKRLAKRKDGGVAVLVLLKIWGELDPATEQWEIRKDSFDYWLRDTYRKPNNYPIEELLEAMREYGLLEFSLVSGDSLVDSCLPSGEGLLDLCSQSGEGLVTCEPSPDMPKTSSGLDEISQYNINKYKTTQTTQSKVSASELVFKKVQTEKSEWSITALENFQTAFPDFKNQHVIYRFLSENDPADVPGTEKLEHWQAAIAQAQKNNVRSPSAYVQTVFKAKIEEAIKANDPDEVYIKDRDGRYAVKNDKNPADDDRVPFEMLSFDCKRFRLIRDQVLHPLSLAPNINKLHDPRLKNFIEEAFASDLGCEETYGPAYKMIGDSH